MTKEFRKILIANRGEVAVRVIRACREMGIKTVAVFSEPDRDSLHVFLADEAYPIGGKLSRESYLVSSKIIDVALKAKVDAIHPGYGFLSEHPEFAKMVEQAGMTFIGPSPEQIELMGDKISAKLWLKKAGIPVVPGSDGPVQDIEQAKRVCREIGYPVMIKAAAGGGGKGMRLVYHEHELESHFRACQSEGENYFGDPTVFIEKYVQNPKHIEVQVLGDKHGNLIHLYERECSIQRRNQKLIEETPSPSLDEETRQRLCEVALKAAKFMKYYSAGTLEFIYDAITKEFFFMEMNTRLQVEHPITEQVCGVDIVKEQIRIAMGYPLSYRQEDIQPQGHAIECRICAEDPVTYQPSPGVIRACRHPQGPFVRVDSYAYSGYQVPLFYDSMIAKVITWGQTRKLAIERMERALTEFILSGIQHNIALHKTILRSEKFLDGTYTTRFLEDNFELLEPDLFKEVEPHVFLIVAAIQAYQDQRYQIKPQSSDRLWRFKNLGC